MTRAVDIGDTLTEYNGSEDGARADARALRPDWQAVGDDRRRAIAQYRQEESPQLANG